VIDAFHWCTWWYTAMTLLCMAVMYRCMYSVSQKSPPPAACSFLTFFDKRPRILNQFFTNLLHVPIYARLQIFIQLSQTLTKLCRTKHDYLVHIICSKCPPSAEMHAFIRLRESLIALLIVVRGKSSQICCFIMSTNMLDMTWRQQWRHLLSKQTYKLSSSEM